MTQLSATHITAGYQHEAILRELTLALPEGQLSVLIGSNGCGKSTLLKTLARLLAPWNARIACAARWCSSGSATPWPDASFLST